MLAEYILSYCLIEVSCSGNPLKELQGPSERQCSYTTDCTEEQFDKKEDCMAYRQEKLPNKIAAQTGYVIKIYCKAKQ